MQTTQFFAIFSLYSGINTAFLVKNGQKWGSLQSVSNYNVEFSVR